MRNLVIQHYPPFHDAHEWTGVETTDFVFPDEKSTLTELLISNGHLERSRWSGKTPTFMIEVKSTMSDRNREFYMSDLQYKQVWRTL
jgi:hypothetical protein